MGSIGDGCYPVFWHTVCCFKIEPLLCHNNPVHKLTVFNHSSKFAVSDRFIWKEKRTIDANILKEE